MQKKTPIKFLINSKTIATFKFNPQCDQIHCSCMETLGNPVNRQRSVSFKAFMIQ